MASRQAGNYLIPGGTCASVGIGGQALGGGLGMASCKYGVLSDSIVGMTMLDATGTIHHINPTSSSPSDLDLFWALRGAGGGSFGLVTEFQIQAYKPPAKVCTFSIDFNPLSHQARSVLRAYGRWARQNPDHNLMTMLFMGRNSAISVQVNYMGPKDQALAAARPMLDLHRHLQQMCHQSHSNSDDGKGSNDNKNSDCDDDQDYQAPVVSEGSWYDSAIHWGGESLADPDLSTNYAYARGRSLLYRHELSDQEIDILLRFVNGPPDISAYVLLDLFGGQMDRSGQGSPAAVAASSVWDRHRGVLFGLQYVTAWSSDKPTPGVICAKCLAWSNATAQALWAAYRDNADDGNGTLEAYQNYIERDLPEALKAYYGDSIERLRQIKRKVDPTNLFRFPQSIPL